MAAALSLLQSSASLTSAGHGGWQCSSPCFCSCLLVLGLLHSFLPILWLMNILLRNSSLPLNFVHSQADKPEFNFLKFEQSVAVECQSERGQLGAGRMQASHFRGEAAWGLCRGCRCSRIQRYPQTPTSSSRCEVTVSSWTWDKDCGHIRAYPPVSGKTPPPQWPWYLRQGVPWSLPGWPRWWMGRSLHWARQRLERWVGRVPVPKS